MRILANENFALAAVESLRIASHDVASIRTDAPGDLDAVIEVIR